MQPNQSRHHAHSSAEQSKATFTEGLILRHIWTMTSTASIGILALFAVDLVDMYFLSLLGEIELASAVGYAGTILFFTVAISLGMMITMVALVSKAIGQGDKALAKREMNSVFAYAFGIMLLVCAGLFIFAEPVLKAMGASGKTLDFAVSYLRIVVVFTPFLAIGMGSNGVMRAMGDAKRSMYTTLAGGVVNAVLDPILIFGFDLGIEGAAYASGISRLSIMALGVYYLIKVYDMWDLNISLSQLKSTFKPIFKIAIPAIFTNMAAPIGGVIMVGVLSQYGTDVVAGFAVLGRVMPVAFVMIYALSGAIGPIIGQNHGAQQTDRIRQTWHDSLLFVLVYSIIVAAILFILSSKIPALFSIDGEGAALITFYLRFLVLGFLFHGITFAANALFNNLGYSQYALVTNLLKSAIFLFPLAFVGSQFGFQGVLIGELIAVILASAVAYWMVRRVLTSISTAA